MATWTVEVLDKNLKGPSGKMDSDTTGRFVASAFDVRGNYHAIYVTYGRIGYLYGRGLDLISERFLQESAEAESRRAKKKKKKDGAEIEAKESVNPWRYETLPVELAPKSEGLALAVDAWGRPHTFYSSSRGLEHVVLTASGWAVGVVTRRVAPANSWSMALGANDVPLVAFQDGAGNFSSYVATMGGWKEEPMERPSTDAGSLIHCFKLRYDNKGVPHLAFLGQINNLTALWKTRRDYPKGQNRASWFPAQTIFAGPENPIASCVLDMSREGIPHLAYLAWTDKHWDGTEKLIYVTRESEDENKWRKKTLVPSVPTSGAKTSLAFIASSKGVPHLIYYNPHQGGLHYWSQDSKGGWVETTIEKSVDLAGSPSVTLDRDGNPWVIYQDASKGQLKLARRMTAPDTHDTQR